MSVNLTRNACQARYYLPICQDNLGNRYRPWCQHYENPCNSKRIVFQQNFRARYKTLNCIGGSRGRARRAPPPPYGSRFFCFDMQNFRNVAASGSTAPRTQVHAPPLREILDPPLNCLGLSVVVQTW